MIKVAVLRPGKDWILEKWDEDNLLDRIQTTIGGFVTAIPSQWEHPLVVWVAANGRLKRFPVSAQIAYNNRLETYYGPIVVFRNGFMEGKEYIDMDKDSNWREQIEQTITRL